MLAALVSREARRARDMTLLGGARSATLFFPLLVPQLLIPPT